MDNLKYNKINQQKKYLEDVYKGAFYAPEFYPNPKYNIGEYKDMIPYISYDDIVNYKYIIRARNKNTNSTKDDKIIAEYKNLDALVNDGWEVK